VGPGWWGRGRRRGREACGNAIKHTRVVRSERHTNKHVQGCRVPPRARSFAPGGARGGGVAVEVVQLLSLLLRVRRRRSGGDGGLQQSHRRAVAVAPPCKRSRSLERVAMGVADGVDASQRRRWFRRRRTVKIRANRGCCHAREGGGACSLGGVVFDKLLVFFFFC
jgi:hypothetical protein